MRQRMNFDLNLLRVLLTVPNENVIVTIYIFVILQAAIVTACYLTGHPNTKSRLVKYCISGLWMT